MNHTAAAEALDPLPTLTDEEVVARVRAGEAALYEILVRRNNGRLYRLVRGVLRDEREIEDVMQQAYVQAYVHLEQFAGGARFSTWLGRIAINEALGQLRRAKSRGADDMSDERELGHVASCAASPEDDASSRELRGVVEGAIDALPAAYRSVFVMREVEELSTAETAACLGLTEETVKVRLHRAKQRLQGDLLGRVDAATRTVFPFLRPRCDAMVARVMRAIARADGPR